MDLKNRNEEYSALKMLPNQGSDVSTSNKLIPTTHQAYSIQQKQEEHAILTMEEARRVVASLSLSSFELGDFLVITNSNFDVTICGEPYLALLLFYSLKCGKFIARIWNETVEVGWAYKKNELDVACQRLFKQGKPCIGHPINQYDENITSQKFWSSHTPIPRVISKSCHKLLHKLDTSDKLSCPECQKLTNLEEADIGENVLEDPGEEYGEPRETKEELFDDDFSHNLVDPDEFETEQSHVQCAKTPSKFVDNKLESLKLSKEINQKFESIHISFGKLKLVKEGDGSEGRICPWCHKVVRSNDRWCEHRKYVHHYGVFTCPVCQFQSHFAKELNEHMKTEVHSGSVICQNCKQHFDAEEIESHYAICTTGCATCKKTFKNKTGHLNHLKYAHKGEHDLEPICCDRCGKKFKNPLRLKDHIKTIHEGRDSYKKPHDCTICGMTFQTYWFMKSHRAKVHFREKNERQCQKCGLKFATPHLLKSHLLSHEAPQFKCSVCGMMLKKRINLEAHERAHRGEKPFPCTICSASFTAQRLLAQHMKGVHKVVGPRGGKVGWKFGQKHKNSDM